MPGLLVVGLQWGDEGKGKMIDILSEKADLILRGQGGNNAGHTIVIKNQEYKFHLIPSGILHPQTTCIIGGGCVINPHVFLSELRGLLDQGIACEGRLFISPSAGVIFPHHILIDELEEKSKGKNSIGTTKKGIGPCYCSLVARHGIRICDLLNASTLKKKLTLISSQLTPYLSFYNEPPLDIDALTAQFNAFGNQLKPYIATNDTLAYTALKEGKNVLLEGANGTYLDITFGTYPYVTSSNTLASGVTCGSALGPTHINHTLGVLKAYTTRVGLGPLPTALTKDELPFFLSVEEAREIGTTTGRHRRIGWFDSPLARHAIGINGINSLALTKLDILDTLDTIKICTGYTLRGQNLTTPPPQTDDWDHLIPIYETLPGWKEPTFHLTTLESLPTNARRYIARLEELLLTPFSFLSLGPSREQTIQLTPTPF